MVTVSVFEFRSQPVSVLGAVNTPGVHQIRGRKTLFEVISEAGGLKNEAGNSIKITRRKEFGAIPLPGAGADPSGEFSVAEVSVKSVMEARNPQENIQIQPNDVISVPKAELVYVIGAVKRAGGFILSEREQISVLQALSMAEGLDRVARPRMPGSCALPTAACEPHGNPGGCEQNSDRQNSATCRCWPTTFFSSPTAPQKARP